MNMIPYDIEANNFCSHCFYGSINSWAGHHMNQCPVNGCWDLVGALRGIRCARSAIRIWSPFWCSYRPRHIVILEACYGCIPHRFQHLLELMVVALSIWSAISAMTTTLILTTLSMSTTMTTGRRPHVNHFICCCSWEWRKPQQPLTTINHELYRHQPPVVACWWIGLKPQDLSHPTIHPIISCTSWSVAHRCSAGLVSCEHRTYPYNHAAIKLTGAILSLGWRFGSVASWAFLSSWRYPQLSSLAVAIHFGQSALQKWLVGTCSGHLPRWDMSHL